MNILNNNYSCLHWIIVLRERFFVKNEYCISLEDSSEIGSLKAVFAYRIEVWGSISVVESPTPDFLSLSSKTSLPFLSCFHRTTQPSPPPLNLPNFLVVTTCGHFFHSKENDSSNCGFTSLIICRIIYVVFSGNTNKFTQRKQPPLLVKSTISRLYLAFSIVYQTKKHFRFIIQVYFPCELMISIAVL